MPKRGVTSRESSCATIAHCVGNRRSCDSSDVQTKTEIHSWPIEANDGYQLRSAEDKDLAIRGKDAEFGKPDHHFPIEFEAGSEWKDPVNKALLREAQNKVLL
jgi:hypothetical protein